MKITLFILLLSTSLPANSLSDVLLIKEPATAERALQEILDFAIQKESGKLPPNILGIEPYILLKTKQEQRLDNFYGDTRIILEIPQATPTFWEKLIPEERLQLVRLIESTMGGGKYEQGKQIWTIKHFPKFGISPELLLLAASRVEGVAVCRHRNIALAGLLLELGANPEWIRIVSARETPSSLGSHLWAEFKVSEMGQWNELDGSAAGFGNGKNRILFPTIIAEQCALRTQKDQNSEWSKCAP